MRHTILFALAAASLALGVSAMSAQANESLAAGSDLATTQPRHNDLTATDRLAYDVDFSGGHLASFSKG